MRLERKRPSRANRVGIRRTRGHGPPPAFGTQLPVMALIAATLVGFSEARADRFEVERGIARKLVCQCGCQMILADCTHETCPSRPVMEAEIRRRVAAGEEPEAIIAALVGEYGVKVLAAPPAEGFNLTIWIAPGLALLLGAVFVSRLIVRWSRRDLESGDELAGGTGEDSGYAERVEKELSLMRNREVEKS